MSSAMWIGWARGKSTTARPMRMRWVRAARGLAIVMGEDKRVMGEKWCSASHTELTTRASAASTNAKHSAKASRSVIPSRYGNSMKSPKSMGVSLLADEARRGGPLADPGKVSLGDLRAWRLRGGDVHRDSPSAGGFHVGQSLLLGGIGIGEELHLDPVRIQEVDAAGHAVVHDVVDGGPSLHEPSYVEKSAVSIAKPKCWRGTEIRDDGYALVSGEKIDAEQWLGRALATFAAIDASYDIARTQVKAGPARCARRRCS